MTNFPVLILLIALIALILISAFFSGSETAMMALNRYRLRHLARQKGQTTARRVQEMLKRPDRLLGVILIGNTFANILASSIATIIAVEYFGDLGVVIVTVILTLVILIFAEITPKTLATLKPQPIAFGASLPLKFLLKILYPLVWLGTSIANGIIRLFGVKLHRKAVDPLSTEELRTVVRDAGQLIPDEHQDMLLRILDLEKTTVDDVMLPRNEIIGVDLADDWNPIVDLIATSSHTRLPVYTSSLDNIVGVLHIRKALKLRAKEKLTRETLQEFITEMYFIPEGTPLTTQLLNFREKNERVAMVVDEYGDLQGMITLEDVLEEIVGEFTVNIHGVEHDIHRQEDGSYLIDGSANLREVNRKLSWKLPDTGPKTLSGLITEYLEYIPKPGTCFKIHGYAIEVIKIRENMVKLARVVVLHR